MTALGQSPLEANMNSAVVSARCGYVAVGPISESASTGRRNGGCVFATIECDHCHLQQWEDSLH
jgi:hypothetical protein